MACTAQRAMEVFLVNPLGFLVNSETGHSEDRQPNLRYALGTVGFLVNSETGHSEVLWALLLTVKQDTVKTSNQIFLLLFLLQKAMPFFL